MTVMRQPEQGRTLLHLVNVSGHSSTGYFAPIPTSEITVELDGDYKTANAVKLNTNLSVDKKSNYSRFILPALTDYEVIILK